MAGRASSLVTTPRWTNYRHTYYFMFVLNQYEWALAVLMKDLTKLFLISQH
jgi:hypothetical protein